MTVQKLIDELNKLENKEMLIIVYDDDGDRHAPTVAIVKNNYPIHSRDENGNDCPIPRNTDYVELN